MLTDNLSRTPNRQIRNQITFAFSLLFKTVLGQRCRPVSFCDRLNDLEQQYKLNRWSAQSWISPLLCCITPISYSHPATACKSSIGANGRPRCSNACLPPPQSRRIPSDRLIISSPRFSNHISAGAPTNHNELIP